MEKIERETHDFMNVNSFSQLPFIRPAPVKAAEKGIRLFGIEFGGATGDTTAVTDESESGDTNMCEDAKDYENGESTRKFECHYCCRNFPTSQALGGHQNAHKRERQHAKRAHLQSVVAHSSISNGNLYGLINYRLGSVPAPAINYPSWNNGNSRFYGNHGTFSHQPPINGNPLGMWRIPAVQSNPNFLNREHSEGLPSPAPLPLFRGDDLPKLTPIGGSSSQNRHVYESSKVNVQDHVSLDLHL